MLTDYARLFETAEELTDFMLLEPMKQDELLMQYAHEGRGGMAVACEVKFGNGAPSVHHDRL